MHSSPSRHEKVNKENASDGGAQKPVARMTRSRAKALRGSAGILSPSKASFKQDQKRVLRASHKRMIADENKASTNATTGFQHKRRAVLKDISNTSGDDLHRDRHNGVKIQVCKQGRREHVENAEKDADISMGVGLDVDDVKAKLAEDLSKIRMVESMEASFPYSGDGEVTEQTREHKGIDQMLLSDGQHTIPVPQNREEQIICQNSGDMDCPEVVDIDKNVKDPQLCSMYAADIYNNIRVTELEHRPLANYMEKVQQEIDPSMRGTLIDWLVEVADEYKLVPDTLYLTVMLIDRFLSQNHIERLRLQLLGVTCMLIASKYEEIRAPAVEEFCFITDHTYTRVEVLKLESRVVNLLHFQLSVPTTKTFLRRFIQAAQASCKRPRVELEFLANYLAELTLVEYRWLEFLPSLIAASAVFLASWTLDQSNHPWNPTLRYYTRYEAPELKTTVLALEDLHLNSSGCILNAIREKYKQQKFKRVAMLTSPERVASLFTI